MPRSVGFEQSSSIDVGAIGKGFDPLFTVFAIQGELGIFGHFSTPVAVALVGRVHCHIAIGKRPV